MQKAALQELAIILGLGTFAQWVSWRFKLPTIVLLLLSGFLVGPITGLVDPDRLFGEALSPIISLAVAVIMYEGGLSLRFSDLPGVKRVIFSLISLGMVCTWLVCTWAASTFLGMDFELAVLLGAVLTVSGPTVIIPLLRDVKPRAPLGTVLRWEGILIDPVGAVAAVLVFEVISSNFLDPTAHFALGAFKAVVSGTLFGLGGAFIVATIMRKYWVPDHLHNPISLGTLFFCYTASEMLQPESGLLTATLMGIGLANSKNLNIHHLIEFKENLQVLLISSLFILLAARVDTAQLGEIGWSSLWFLLVIIFVARPLSVFVSTVGSDLSWRERAFVSLIYPRGIVAAAVSSIFAIELTKQGFPNGDLLAVYTFFVIFSCGVFYGGLARVFARVLKVQQGVPQGVLFVGANTFARQLAGEIKKLGSKVLMVDSNWTNIATAKIQGLPVYHGNILSEYLADELNLDGIGRLFGVTPNQEANSLASVRYAQYFGRAQTYQVPSETFQSEEHTEIEHPLHLRGRFLFHSEADFFHLEELMEKGAQFRYAPAATRQEWEELQKSFGEENIPLLLVSKSAGDFEPVTVEAAFREKADQELLLLTLAAKSA